jgi:hypothetical protein
MRTGRPQHILCASPETAVSCLPVPLSQHPPSQGRDRLPLLSGCCWRNSTTGAAEQTDGEKEESKIDLAGRRGGTFEDDEKRNLELAAFKRWWAAHC